MIPNRLQVIIWIIKHRLSSINLVVGSCEIVAERSYKILPNHLESLGVSSHPHAYADKHQDNLINVTFQIYILNWDVNISVKLICDKVHCYKFYTNKTELNWTPMKSLFLMTHHKSRETAKLWTHWTPRQCKSETFFDSHLCQLNNISLNSVRKGWRENGLA